MKTVNSGMDSPTRLLTFFILIANLITTSTSTSLSLKEKDSNYLKSVVEATPYRSNESHAATNGTIALANEPNWGYGCVSGIGPNEWGELSPEWSLCSTGTEQSPIGILSFDVTKNERVAFVQITHHPAPASILNDGNLIRLRWKGGFLHIDGILYELHEAQFHTPSEHTIDGKRYPLEMQMMHKNAKNSDMAILSILFKLDDKDNKFLGQFLPYIPSLGGNPTMNITGGVNPKGLDLKERHFYQYRGSLTTPPCAEGVVWIVMKKKHKVSPVQVDMLYAALKHENSRPIQALKGRTVYKGK